MLALFKILRPPEKCKQETLKEYLCLRKYSWARFHLLVLVLIEAKRMFWYLEYQHPKLPQLQKHTLFILYRVCRSKELGASTRHSILPYFVGR